MQQYLASNFYVDSDHPDIVAFVREHGRGSSPVERAMSLYYAVRDGFRYNPWRVKSQPEDFKASTVLTRAPGEGAHCVDKANLLAACARAVEIPARLHFSNVRNHIGTGELEKKLGTDLLVFHGYCEMHLEGRWVASTPAFNRELCEYLDVAPLEFDGRTDSIFQQYDRAGGLFMEYVHDYGTFPEIPFEMMISAWEEHYPGFRAGQWPNKD